MSLRGGTTKQPRRVQYAGDEMPLRYSADRNDIREKSERTKKALQMQGFPYLHQNVSLRHLQFLLYISYVAFEFFVGINQVLNSLAGLDHGRVVAAAEEVAY